MSEHARLPTLSADVMEWERHAVALRADNDRLRAAITTAVEALRAESDWQPSDTRWPILSLMVADDLARAAGGDDG